MLKKKNKKLFYELDTQNHQSLKWKVFANTYLLHHLETQRT